MQWIDGVLSKKEQVEFFHDEFRCPVYVKDVVTIILSLINKWIIGMQLHASIFTHKKTTCFSPTLINYTMLFTLGRT
jgi:dTDP-4-dehydrorhamnose reductase